MSRDKQIEEKTKVISDICPLYKEYGSCEQCDTELDVDDEPCYWECMANAIIRYGYRKASEFAREIFETFRAEMRAEIARNEMLFKEDEDDFYDGRNDAFRTAINCLAELKKKYIGEDTNVLTNTVKGK